ncbi:unnamed protein product [Citrullus colocynthis]|uniref:Uncharacterized protein n=1 Tax=Citrullus colocynthis TaxID=252529 RepID=A0ABP0XYW0_9ROSI
MNGMGLPHAHAKASQPAAGLRKLNYISFAIFGSLFRRRVQNGRVVQPHAFLSFACNCMAWGGQMLMANEANIGLLGNSTFLITFMLDLQFQFRRAKAVRFKARSKSERGLEVLVVEKSNIYRREQKKEGTS